MKENIVKFKRVYIEITNKCNLSCEFCPKTTRVPLEMSLENFEKVIIQVKEFTKYIYLHVMGEPLFHSEFESILDLIRKHNLKAVITTNGVLIDKQSKVIIEHCDCVHKIVFSLHSFEANANGIDFNGYLKKIVNFAKLSSKKKIINVLRLWNEDNTTKKGYNSLNDDILNTLEKYFVKTINQFTIRDEKLADNIYLQKSSIFEWTDESVKNNVGFCYGLRTHFAVLSDGTVVPCCLDNNGNIRLGNIFSESLYDIIFSKKARAIYDGFSKRKLIENRCKTCGFIQERIVNKI